MSQILKPKKGYKKVKWLFGKTIEIPEEWNTETLGSTCDQIQDMDHKMPEKINKGIPFLSISDIVNKSEIDFSNQKYISEEDYSKFSKKLQPKKNDLLYSRVATIGESRIIREEKRFAFTYNVVLIKTGKKIKSLFLKYALDFPIIKNRVKSIAPQGAYPFLGLGDIEKIPIIVPPIPEQQKITSILSNVDNLITTTQKVIDQTKQLKKGLMQKLLTKGIGHTKFKNVPWYFGKEIEIPEEWEVRTLDSLVTLLTNGFVGKATVHYTESENGVLYVQGYNIKENNFNFHGIKRVSQEFDEQNKKSRLQSGDLLTIQTGNVGTTAIVPNELVGANCHALIISRLKREIADPEFYSQYFNSHHCQRMFKMIEIGTSLKHLNGSDMKKLQFLRPPLPEQQKIVSILSNVDSKIQSQEQYKEKLQRLKKSLMQKLLTGQVRVAV